MVTGKAPAPSPAAALRFAVDAVSSPPQAESTSAASIARGSRLTEWSARSDVRDIGMLAPFDRRRWVALHLLLGDPNPKGRGKRPGRSARSGSRRPDPTFGIRVP